ncbi:MAG: hypothetical protein CVU87_00855 [Firmicutes bacterium HGW-Firmicutes-12]|nr:MAG: hypothetical protein CVU87_00855 [Firmicutes bacterium HGW-Firmicutes-12]
MHKKRGFSVIKKDNGKLWLPRNTWQRKPQTQVEPNKKQKLLKAKCRKPVRSYDEPGLFVM